MGIQAQLNQEAFKQLNKTYAAMQFAQGASLGSMEQIALRELSNCIPCIDDMNQEQKNRLDEKILDIFKFREYI